MTRNQLHLAQVSFTFFEQRTFSLIQGQALEAKTLQTNSGFTCVEATRGDRRHMSGGPDCLQVVATALEGDDMTLRPTTIGIKIEEFCSINTIILTHSPNDSNPVWFHVHLQLDQMTLKHGIRSV